MTTNKLGDLETKLQRLKEIYTLVNSNQIGLEQNFTLLKEAVELGKAVETELSKMQNFLTELDANNQEAIN